MVFHESDGVGKLAVLAMRRIPSRPLAPAATHAAASGAARTHLTSRADCLHRCIECRTEFRIKVWSM